MKSLELAVNIERVIRSLENTWTIIKLVWRGRVRAGRGTRMASGDWGEGGAKRARRRVPGTR